MRRAHCRVPLDHAQRFPAALLADGLEINAGHDATAGPVAPPIVYVEIDDARALACGRVRFLNGRAAGHLVVTRISVRFSAIGDEYYALGRRAARNPEPVQCGPRLGMHPCRA